MARTEIKIDPVSRVSGLLDISVEVENNSIVEARSGGMQFRGFEAMFRERPPLDMPYLTARTCGICCTHHTLAASLALEEALGIIPSPNGVVVRELADGFEFLQNHLRHVYQFVFPDYVNIENVNPLHKTDAANADFRLPPDINARLTADYFNSLAFSRKAHTALATLAGKAPHPHGIFVGGTTTNMTIIEFNEVTSILNEIKNFVEVSLIPDMYIIASYYSDYYEMGRGYGNFLCYGLYDNPAFPVKFAFPGVIINGVKEDVVDNGAMIEDLRFTWANAPGDVIIPGNNLVTPDATKPNAYSWVSAPRYRGYPMEVGPLARMYINGYYTRGISAMDRLIARSLETLRICECMQGLLEIIRLEPAYQERWPIPVTARGIGRTEASRGSLTHWLDIGNSVVSNYTLMPPSSWNLSPRDNNEVRGPVEEALIGTYIKDMLHPVEIGRIVRSFDPCLNCAAHVTSDRHSPLTIRII